MPAKRVARRPLALLPVAASGLVAACLSGCGEGSQEMQLPEQAKKTVERRKVDFQARPAKPKPGVGGSRTPSAR
jgi:hypothetical protein